jgi:chromosome segregation ATPase
LLKKHTETLEAHEAAMSKIKSDAAFSIEDAVRWKNECDQSEQEKQSLTQELAKAWDEGKAMMKSLGEVREEYENLRF